MYKIKEQEIKEINDYLDRFKTTSPEEILDILKKMRDFTFKYMTQDGKKFYQEKIFREKGIKIKLD